MALLLSLAPPGHGAGLGELRRQSALGEPLDVVINLSGDNKAELDETSARIATSEIYDALGIQRNAVLEAAHIRIERKNGATQLRITSPAIVMEPILSLVVEIDYGGGVIRRNYDLLMDPPPAGSYERYASTAGEDRDQAEESIRPSPDQGSRRVARSRPRPADEIAALPAQMRPAAAATVADGGEYGPVAWGSTLSNIAFALRADRAVPLARAEQALYEANPQAFSGGPSRLLAGARLHIPQGELFRHGTATAVAEQAPPAAAAAMAAPVLSSNATMTVAGAEVAPSGVSHLFRLAERLDLSAVAFTSPIGPARQDGETGAKPAAAAVAGVFPRRPDGVAALAATTTASMHAGGAAALQPAGARPWQMLFSWPLWGSIALFWLGFAWARMRPTAKAKPGEAQQALAGRVNRRPPQSLAAPNYPSLALNAPEYSGLSAPASSRRKLHAAERAEFGVSADLRTDDIPRAEPAGAPAAAHGHGGEAEIEVTDRSYYAEAEDFLVSALALNPERADLRLKLLEIYCSAGNLEGFTEQARQYMIHNKGELSAHWNDVRRMGLDLDPNWSLVKASGPDATVTASSSGVRRFYDGLDQPALNAALKQLEVAYGKVRNDPAFIAAIAELCGSEAGLPTPFLHAVWLSKKVGGAQIYIKRDDLRPRNSDLLVNALGQVLLAKWIGRTTVTAGLEDGGHGEAVAKAAKALRVPAVICVPQALMEVEKYPALGTLGALNAILTPAGDEDGVAVPDGRRSAMKRWLEAPGEQLFISSLRTSPMPFPVIVRDFQALVGQEIRRQAFRYAGGLPRAIVSDIAAGYSTFGLIQSFLDTGEVQIDCVKTLDAAAAPVTPESAAPSYTRELDWLHTCKQVNFPTISREAVAAAAELCRQSGESIPEPRNAGALAHAIAIAKELPPSASVVALFA